MSVICFFKIVKLLSHKLNPVDAFLNQIRQNNRKRKYLIFIAVATTFLVGTIDLQLKLTTNSNSAGYLPKKLGNVQVLTSNVHPGLREGCDLHIFELKAGISNKIKKIGITYFEGDTQPRADITLKTKDTNPYSQWSYTSVPEDSYSWSALNCGKETDRELINLIRSGMEGTSGYYIMTRNKEGVIVVLPNENLAAFLYYG